MKSWRALSDGSSRRLSLLALVAFFVACGGPDASQSSAPVQEPLVEAVAARAGSLPVAEVVSGAVRARNQVAIRAETSARVVEVMVRSGDPVRRGQVLVRLDESEERERLRQAEADVRVEEAAAAASEARVAELEARVARVRTLAAEQLVSVQELETLEAQLAALRASAAEAAARVAQAQAAAQERRSALDKTLVRAPVAGVLGERLVEVGMLVDSGSVLFVVGDLDDLIVEVTLSEEMLSRVEEGQQVLIEPRSGVEPVAATLSRISPFLARQSFSTTGEIDVDNRERRLRPGMFVSVRILVGESRRATLVPVSAVWEDPETGEIGVFAIEEPSGLEEPSSEPDPASLATPSRSHAASFRPVTVLAEGRGQAGVDGIEEGTWVVTVGQHLLRSPAAVAAADAAGPRARVRPVSWGHVLELQGLQDEDLLEGFLEKQGTLAAAIGAQIPDSEDVVTRVLEEAAASKAKGQGGS